MKSDKVLYYELFVNYIISSTSKYKRLKISRWNYYANYKYIYLKLSYSTLKNTNQIQIQIIQERNKALEKGSAWINKPFPSKYIASYFSP